MVGAKVSILHNGKTLSELVDKVKSYGALGEYLFLQMIKLNDFYGQAPMRIPFAHGESWVLGDNPTGKDICVYDSIDTRLCLHDFFSKIKLCYGRHK
ncbi:hypothetical protein NYE33_13420 [Paenibacillus sp. FSL R10-2199]|uniref:hypothetical protein n=1 Tax=Paenibacillus sp. FSL R10-2199 TaxID=2975348 RepID=UPI0030F64DCC